MALILLIDDSMFSRNMTAKMLTKAGHQILQAENGLAGLKTLHSTTPDCIVSDILMPQMDGKKFYMALKARNLQVPVVFLTADAQTRTRASYLELGAIDVLNKPPSEETLLAAVQKAVGKES